eukprot:GHVQ01016326.1.p1 GENE.GHVQ01016326.1~~GHVQ01016326.1.p1  ORF type:complete len:147 (+),score=19.35 GHVQ01016326.1:998-1438(+)
MRVKGMWVNAVVDTGAWLSILTEKFAAYLGIVVTNSCVSLQGIGRAQGCLTETAFDTACKTRFCVLKDFMFDCVLGLRDLFQIPVVASLLRKLCKTVDWPILCATVHKDIASRVDESLADVDLLQKGKDTLRQCSASVSSPIFERV